MNKEVKEILVNEIEEAVTAPKKAKASGVEIRTRASSPALRISYLERSNEAAESRIKKLRKIIALNKRKIKAEMMLQKLEEERIS